MSGRDVSVGIVGAGNFARSVILPCLDDLEGATLSAVATASGANARSVARKYGCNYATTDYERIVSDDDIDLVVVATRHDLHADLAVEALSRGKNVHVEKPLALNVAGTERVIAAERESKGRLVVGFNRRFAPQIMSIRRSLANRLTPIMATYRVNIDSQPDHWIHDPEEGGGRIRSEVCHFVDLLAHLSNGRPERVYASRVELSNGLLPDENVHIIVDCSDGSRGQITYTSLGDDSLPKERLEVFGGNKAHVVDDFRTGVLGIDQDKGHRNQFEAFVRAIRMNRPSPTPVDELVASTLATFAVITSVQQGEPIVVDPPSEYL